jgi:hypothetical protein
MDNARWSWLGIEVHEGKRSKKCSRRETSPQTSLPASASRRRRLPRYPGAEAGGRGALGTSRPLPASALAASDLAASALTTLALSAWCSAGDLACGAAEVGPAAAVRHGITPGSGVNPVPAPGVDPDPATVATRCPARGIRLGPPDRAGPPPGLCRRRGRRQCSRGPPERACEMATESGPGWL